ncbi:MAG: hypothetical protein ACXVEF_05760 [Polyangiales bacterium]
MTDVIVDTLGVRRTLRDGSVESIAWASLDEVAIVTTSEGPFAEDVFYVLREGDHGVVVSQEAATEIALLDWLQRLPGFRNEAVIEAMGSVDDARFVCWQKERKATLFG